MSASVQSDSSSSSADPSLRFFMAGQSHPCLSPFKSTLNARTHLSIPQLLLPLCIQLQIVVIGVHKSWQLADTNSLRNFETVAGFSELVAIDQLMIQSVVPAHPLFAPPMASASQHLL
jgi:hypothetical protein